MQCISNIHPNTALDLANADHRRRIERAQTHRLAASLRSPVERVATSVDPTTPNTTGSTRSTWARLFARRSVARSIGSVVTGLVLVGAMLAAAPPAHANPCIADRQFAEANGCADVYEAAHAATTIVANSDRFWLLHIAPADAAAVRAADSLRIVSVPLRAI